MTWAEFRIRSFAFSRMQERDEYKLRELAWITYIAPHLNPKKMKKSIKSFWPIGRNKNKSGPTDKMIAVMKAAKEKYLKEKQDAGK